MNDQENPRVTWLAQDMVGSRRAIARFEQKYGSLITNDTRPEAPA